jgi:hypothetical protein
MAKTKQTDWSAALGVQARTAVEECAARTGVSMDAAVSRLILAGAKRLAVLERHAEKRKAAKASAAEEQPA